MQHMKDSSVRGILPPHMLIALAQNGNEQQKRIALQTLSHDHSIRTTRMAHAMLTYRNVPGHMTLSSDGRLRRTISDAHCTNHLPGDVVRNEGQEPIHDICANEAYDALGWFHAFFMQVYLRNSIDNEGMPMDATIHYSMNYNNTFWTGERMICGDGDHDLFNRSTCCLDIIAHELTHGIIESEARLAYLGQPGALNEHVSDVFGSLVKQYVHRQSAEQADWLIGNGIYTEKIHGSALRSLRSLRSRMRSRPLPICQSPRRIARRSVHRTRRATRPAPRSSAGYASRPRNAPTSSRRSHRRFSPCSIAP